MELVNRRKLSKAEIVWTVIIIALGVSVVALLVCAIIFHWDLSNAGS